MSTPESVRSQLEKLRSDANAATGYEDATLTEAVARLIAGYGTGSGKVCEHTNTKFINFRYDEELHNSHWFDVVCTDCGTVVYADEMGDCEDTDGDGLCDLCGGCIHEMEDKYTANGDGTHIKKRVCSKCGQTRAQQEDPCQDKDGDGYCDQCKGEMPGDQCEHSNLKYTYMSENGYATHVKYSICQDCGKCVDTKYGEACSDIDSDGVCDLCGGPMACQHVSLQNPTYTDIGYGLHHLVATCQDCGEALDEYAPHEDNGTGVCKKCGAEIPSSYAAGSLNSVAGYRLSVEDGKLKCLKPDVSKSNTAVAMKGGGSTATSISGQGIMAIPIPLGRSNIVLTAGNTYAVSVEIIFLKGTKDAVESYDATSLNFADSVVTVGFEANKWDYVVFNIGYSGTTSPVVINQIGTKATLVFE